MNRSRVHVQACSDEYTRFPLDIGYVIRGLPWIVIRLDAVRVGLDVKKAYSNNIKGLKMASKQSQIPIPGTNARNQCQYMDKYLDDHYTAKNVR